jgi:hypothetical protein
MTVARGDGVLSPSCRFNTSNPFSYQRRHGLRDRNGQPQRDSMGGRTRVLQTGVGKILNPSEQPDMRTAAFSEFQLAEVVDCPRDGELPREPCLYCGRLEEDCV